ncbi:hypothetical protein AB7M25_001866 [Pseudomonas sp. AP3_22 TE3818]
MPAKAYSLTTKFTEPEPPTQRLVQFDRWQASSYKVLCVPHDPGTTHNLWELACQRRRPHGSHKLQNLPPPTQRLVQFDRWQASSYKVLCLPHDPGTTHNLWELACQRRRPHGSHKLQNLPPPTQRLVQFDRWQASSYKVLCLPHDPGTTHNLWELACQRRRPHGSHKLQNLPPPTQRLVQFDRWQASSYKVLCVPHDPGTTHNLWELACQRRRTP